MGIRSSNLKLLILGGIVSVLLIVVYLHSSRPVAISHVQASADAWCQQLTNSHDVVARDFDGVWMCLTLHDVDLSQFGTCVNEAGRCIPCPGAPRDDITPSFAFHQGLLKIIELEAKAVYNCETQQQQQQQQQNKGAAESEEEELSQEEIQAAAEKANVFHIQFTLNKGIIIFECHRDWSPLGVSRLFDMVKDGFFNHNIYLFRAVPNFVAQFGIHGDPKVSSVWRGRPISDDPSIGHSNLKGTISFAAAGKNSRTTQLFFNLVDNTYLDATFPTLGKIVNGIAVLDKINTKYGEQPNQGKIQTEGNKYLESEFPELDFISSAKFVSFKQS